MKKKQDITIVIDSREQKPFRFKNSSVKGLKTGDYSVSGYEDSVCVERKSHADLFSSLGTGRKRFERELQRMSELEYAAIVIEAGLPDLLRQPPFSQMNPKSVVNTLVSWSIKYGVHVFFAQDRRHARALTYRILEKFHRNVREREKRSKGSIAEDCGQDVRSGKS